MDFQFRRLKNFGTSSLIEVCVERGKMPTNPDINHWTFLGTITLPNDVFDSIKSQNVITRNIYITDALEFSKNGEAR